MAASTSTKLMACPGLLPAARVALGHAIAMRLGRCCRYGGGQLQDSSSG